MVLLPRGGAKAASGLRPRWPSLRASSSFSCAPLLSGGMIALTVSFVLATELMNSALEALVNQLHPERHPEIRVIKDMAAGGVLLASVGALIVGFLLLVTMLWP